MAESNNIPVSNSNSDLIDTSENATGEINTSYASDEEYGADMDAFSIADLSTMTLQEFNFNGMLVVNSDTYASRLGYTNESDIEDDEYDILSNIREFFGDVTDVNDHEHIVTDPIKRITRNDTHPYPRSPSKDFIPKKLTENVDLIIPVLFTTKNILPSDLFLLQFDIESDYKKVIQYVLNGTDGIFIVSRKLNQNATILGSTVEIYKITGQKESVESPVYLMAHQMCEILSVEPFPGVLDTTSIGLAKIKILPANISCYPYQKLGTTMRKRYSKKGDKPKKDRCMQPNLSPWSNWVYNQIEPVTLASRLTANVKLLYTDISLTFEDPYLLSFEVLNLNIFSEQQKHYLQSMNSSHQRIQYEIQSMDNLICFFCSAVVTSIENVFNISFANLLGYGGKYFKLQSTGMITTTKLNVEAIIGTELPSWQCLHAGYKWQKMSCGSCGKRLGCRYITEKNSLETPKIFFGLKRSAVTSTKYYLTKQEQENIKPLSANEAIGYWSLIRD